MKNTDTGGSAFPQPPIKYVTSSGGSFYAPESAGGMTLLDYFAAAALQGVLAGEAGKKPDDHATYQDASKWAYKYAEHMLAEKRRREEAK